MEFLVVWGFALLFTYLVYRKERKIEDLIIGIALFFITFSLVSIIFGSIFEGKIPYTYLKYNIDEIQISEKGYFLTFEGRKEFLNKDNIKIEISDKNELVKQTKEYDKWEEVFPHNILITMYQSENYTLHIKSEIAK